MTPPNQAAMEQAMELHTHDVSRVLVAEMICLSADMTDSVDDSDRLDQVESQRADWLEAEKVCSVLLELRSEILRECPQGKAYEIVSARHKTWREVAEYRYAQLKAASGSVCAECGVSVEHVGDLRPMPGVNRGSFCDGCCAEMERGQGVGF